MIELFTVSETRISNQGTALLPGFCLADSRPEVGKIIQGCILVLVYPDGRLHTTKLVNYGIAVTIVDDCIQMNVNPALEPEKVFVQIIVEPQEVPVGTKVLFQ